MNYVGQRAAQQTISSLFLALTLICLIKSLESLSPEGGFC